MRQSIERQPLKADNETCGQQLPYCDCFNDTDVLYVDAIKQIQISFFVYGDNLQMKFRLS